MQQFSFTTYEVLTKPKINFQAGSFVCWQSRSLSKHSCYQKGMVTNMRLENSFFLQDAETCAPRLLGKIICIKKDDNIVKYRITETECYKGKDDSACHASKGKTERNSPMWLCGGHAYVYLCYGMYNMFNIITGQEDDPQGVLIRGVEGLDGPGKFTKNAGIDRSFNKEDMRNSDRLWIESDGTSAEYTALPRVGIDYASEEDIKRPWRYKAVKFVKTD